MNMNIAIIDVDLIGGLTMGKIILMGVFAIAAAPVVALGLIGGAVAKFAVETWEIFKGAD